MSSFLRYSRFGVYFFVIGAGVKYGPEIYRSLRELIQKPFNTEHTNSANEFLNRNNIKNFYEKISVWSGEIIEKILLGTMRNFLNDRNNYRVILNNLKSADSNSRSDLFKVLTNILLTRIFSEAICCTILIAYVKIRMIYLGAHQYCQNTPRTQMQSENPFDCSIEDFITGFDKVINLTERNLKQVFGSLSLDCELNNNNFQTYLHEFSTRIREMLVQYKFEIFDYFLENERNPLLERNEIRATLIRFLNTSDMNNCLIHILESSFEILNRHYFERCLGSNIKLAKLLPKLKQLLESYECEQYNFYLSLTNDQILNIYCLNIFESLIENSAHF